MGTENKGLKPRKIPMRQCLGCNEHKPKMELIRIVRSPEGEISLDLSGKKSGRGAYICRNMSCLKKVRWSARSAPTSTIAWRPSWPTETRHEPRPEHDPRG